MPTPPTAAASAATTDPDELLEVHDRKGRPTGVAKRRAEIHRDGDWHLAFFCWIVTGAGDVVLQKRAATKDVWPGRFDASAAGHVRFGETMAQAAREIEEELGVTVMPSELLHVMRHRQEHVHASGLVDREIHEVHVARCDVPLEAYRPGPEVSGIAAVCMSALVALAEGTREELATTLLTRDALGGVVREAVILRRDHLVPYDPGYHRAVALAAAAACAR